MRLQASIHTLIVTAITTLHGLAALWCYHHAFDNILLFILAFAVIWTFVTQALHCAYTITIWLNVMVNPNKYAD